MALDSESVVSTLDHIDNITVPGDVFRRPANEYWALICLRDGMEFLYRQASKADRAAGIELPAGFRFSAQR
jgi:hypothetical protein